MSGSKTLYWQEEQKLKWSIFATLNIWVSTSIPSLKEILTIQTNVNVFVFQWNHIGMIFSLEYWMDEMKWVWGSSHQQVWKVYYYYYYNLIQRRYSRFFTISQRRELSPTRTLKWPGRNCVQITCNTSSVDHVQVSCYVPRGTKEQLSYYVWKSWNRIYLSFILLAEPLNRWRRGGNQSTQRKPLATSFKKCHILQPEDSSPKRDSNPRSSIGGRLGKQTC